MAITYPTTLDTLTNPIATDTQNSPSHAGQHADANDAIEALQAKVGTNSSAVTSSHDYKLSEVTSTDKSVGKTATQTLTNKTIASANNTLTGVALLSGDQTIAGVKTFSSSPVVPAPTTDLQAATKKYVDDNAGAGGKYEIIIPGTAVAGTGQGTWHAPTGITTVDTIQIIADTAGATGSTVADINKNATSIFPTATKPTLAGTATSNTATPDTTSVTAGDIYTVDLDSITTTAPQTVRIVFYYS